jgi:predicted ferric reductase
MINLTGILAIGCMSAGIFLATRSTSMEPFLGGLDKNYRLHKWLGISALVFSTLHWLWVKAPNWLIGLGWMQRPSREPDLPSGETLSAIARILSQYRGLAASVGEWAFYTVQCSDRIVCWACVLTGTKRMCGRCIASQIASASAASVLLLFT